MDADRFAAFLAAFTAAPSRRTALRVLGALGLAGLVGHAGAKDKKKHKKKCAKAGQAPRKKRKRCCAGLVPDGTGVCASPIPTTPPGCTPATCPPAVCGEVPDGCGGTLTCGCPANQLCLSTGTCQSCTVTCIGTPIVCGAALQAALDVGGTVYVCPGRYQGGFILSRAVRVIGAGHGAAAASNTILDGQGAGRVLRITDGVGLIELERLRLTGGTTSSSGAGILHLGTTLRMTECTVSDNSCDDSFGGGINVGNGRILEMTRCTVRANHSRAPGQITGGEGGGINSAGTTTLTDCVIEANDAASAGGGLHVAQGTSTLLGTTQVRDNEAVFGGGGGIVMGNNGRLVIAETCRVTGNTAPEDKGGGISNANSGTVTLLGADPSPIVVNNCHENCVGTVPTCAATPVSC